MAVKYLELAGRRWAILPEKEYKRLAALAKATGDGAWPDLPKPDAEGNYPAAEYARASLARKIIKGRRLAGLSQAELARRAGIRPETLNRIEKGRTTPAVATVAKIERALDSAAAEDA